MMKNNKSKIVTEDFTSFKDFVKGGVLKLKSVWTSLKDKISNLFSSKLKDALLGDEIKITIPIDMKVEVEKELKEGALAAIQGNYNEVLVLLMLYTISSPYVKISEKYKKYKSDIIASANKWASDLKAAVSGESYAKAESIIKRGSEDMAKYLIEEAAKNNSVIIGGYSDNISFQRGGISSKADIQLFIRKGSNEMLQGYSLKMYTSKNVNLANATAYSFAKHLGGEKAAAAVKNKINSDPELKKLIDEAKKQDQIKKALKKIKKGTEKDINSGMTALKKLTKYSEKQIAELDIKAVDAARTAARKPINPRIAQIVYDVLEPISHTPEFAENILKILGFTDKDTKMLMSVVKVGKTGTKSEILAGHPELDLNKIKLVKSGISIHIKGPTGKNILSFGVKEGEKALIFGKVDFSSVDPYKFINDEPLFTSK